MSKEKKERRHYPFPDAPFADPVFGQPESCADLVNKYGTYNIQPTADTENVFPLISHARAVEGHGDRKGRAGAGIKEARGRTARFLYSSGTCFMEREIRCFFSSTSSTTTFTTSPTATASLGCLINLLHTCEMWTRPS